jgi:hypothetical protein
MSGDDLDRLETAPRYLPTNHLGIVETVDGFGERLS